MLKNLFDHLCRVNGTELKSCLDLGGGSLDERCDVQADLSHVFVYIAWMTGSERGALLVFSCMSRICGSQTQSMALQTVETFPMLYPLDYCLLLIVVHTAVLQLQYQYRWVPRSQTAISSSKSNHVQHQRHEWLHSFSLLFSLAITAKQHRSSSSLGVLCCQSSLMMDRSSIHGCYPHQFP